MKKALRLLAIILLFTIALTGCNISKTWQKSYLDFFDNHPEFLTDDSYSFSVRDIDADTIPELILIKADEKEQTKHISVYSIADDVYKAGECESPNSYSGSFYVSDDPNFPGLFSLKWGGGTEHYGYLTVADRQLLFEDLRSINRNTAPPEEKVLSDKKDLVNESMRIFASADTSDNILVTYRLTENNIDYLLN